MSNAKPYFSRTDAPKGVYSSDKYSELHYEIRPRPADSSAWIERLCTNLRKSLEGIMSDHWIPDEPVVTECEDSVSCVVRVDNTADVEKLCEIDDRVYDAIWTTNVWLERREAAQDELERKLKAVRSRRAKWSESHFR